jgi:anthranilate synthase component 2
MKVLVFDNYDSFTYNLVHLVKKVMPEAEIDVFRNNEMSLEKVVEYDKIILSPGPGIPAEAGKLLELIKKYAPTKSILGVCLGHQAIGEVFGGTLINLDTVYHGIALNTKVVATNDHLFKGLPDKITTGRYHSWVISDKNFPDELEVTALDDNGYIMALRHKKYDVQGVQFHPESVLTPDGETMMRNWLSS